jgi:hypothetical protein
MTKIDLYVTADCFLHAMFTLARQFHAPFTPPIKGKAHKLRKKVIYVIATPVPLLNSMCQ